MEFGREDGLIGNETSLERPKKLRKLTKEDEIDFRLVLDGGRGMPLGRFLFALSAAV